ncbi:acyltransferase family protein [Ancylobacter oerskovii]|uniref:Acyltransferase family protein n=1 Tax=Ancylobacter oerskovii TaxID=459519 RepID=A0ABW4Z057_9HYPH|nr:acyltransferase [Ancylobacter oerskovii]MBS7542963.1 acyltransferase [Ancylobacter oerskovii]
MQRWGAIEGLRGILALWAALNHMIAYSGVAVPGWAAQWLVNGATHAVHVFMIISGFVITHLVLGKREAYVPYLCRRFLRLFPAFAVCVGLGWASYGWFIHGLETFAGPSLVALYQGRADAVAGAPVAYFLAQMTMLHGMLPKEVLPYADGVFLGTGWSVSLEWQFYLVAPFVVAALGTVRGAVAVVALCVVLWTAAAGGLFGTFARDSLLFAATPYFLVGIGSRLAWPAIQGKAGAGVALVLLAGALAMLAPAAVALLVWAVFFPLLVTGAGDAVLCHPAMLWLGRISYSIYLLHIIVIGLVMGLAASLVPSMSSGMLLASMLASLPVIIAGSALLHRFVEVPGMAMGRRAPVLA